MRACTHACVYPSLPPFLPPKTRTALRDFIYIPIPKPNNTKNTQNTHTQTNTVRALLSSREATPANVAALRAYVTQMAPQAAPFLTEEDMVQVGNRCKEEGREMRWGGMGGSVCVCVWVRERKREGA